MCVCVYVVAEPDPCPHAVAASSWSRLVLTTYGLVGKQGVNMCLFAHRSVFGLQCEQRCERREAALGFVVGTLPDTRTCAKAFGLC